MASKLRCPYCRRMLKQEGDEMKQSQGAYRVHTLRAETTGETARLCECLECGQTFSPMAGERATLEDA